MKLPTYRVAWQASDGNMKQVESSDNRIEIECDGLNVLRVKLFGRAVENADSAFIQIGDLCSTFLLRVGGK